MEGGKGALRYRNRIDMTHAFDTHVLEINFIRPESRVLDVGCACGDVGAAVKQYRRCLLYGLEYDADALRVAGETGAYAALSRVDLDTLSGEDFPGYRGFFDHILCGDVLEHLRDPWRVLELLKTYLKPEGSLVASVPNIAHASIKASLLLDDFTYTPMGLLDETHIRFFTHKSLAEGLSARGWRVEDCAFTCTQTGGWQPENPFPLLSDEVKHALFDDWHSFVCQYVMKLVPSGEGAEALLARNREKLAVHERNAPPPIRENRAYELSRLGKRSAEIIRELREEIGRVQGCLAQEKARGEELCGLMEAQRAVLEEQGRVMEAQRAAVEEQYREQEAKNAALEELRREGEAQRRALRAGEADIAGLSARCLDLERKQARTRRHKKRYKAAFLLTLAALLAGLGLRLGS